MCHCAPLLLACAYRKCCAVVERHQAIIVFLVYVLNRLVYPNIPLTNVGLHSARSNLFPPKVENTWKVGEKDLCLSTVALL